MFYIPIKGWLLKELCVHNCDLNWKISDKPNTRRVIYKLHTVRHTRTQLKWQWKVHVYIRCFVLLLLSVGGIPLLSPHFPHNQKSKPIRYQIWYWRTKNVYPKLTTNTIRWRNIYVILIKIPNWGHVANNIQTRNNDIIIWFGS